MNLDSLIKLTDTIVNECEKLKTKYINTVFEIDYICIFSHSDGEYKNLLDISNKIGDIVDPTPTGPVFAIKNTLGKKFHDSKFLKIRLPDSTRPQKGYVDYNSEYFSFKKKYLNNQEFTLIKRIDFEMIELKDPNFDVLVYFSSNPLSQRLNIK